MTPLLQKPLRALLRHLSGFPGLKRVIVDTVYQLPLVDAYLRSIAHRAAHPEARLDVTAKCLPEGSRRSFERMRARSAR